MRRVCRKVGAHAAHKKGEKAPASLTDGRACGTFTNALIRLGYSTEPKTEEGRSPRGGRLLSFQRGASMARKPFKTLEEQVTFLESRGSPPCQSTPPTPSSARTTIALSTGTSSRSSTRRPAPRRVTTSTPRERDSVTSTAFSSSTATCATSPSSTSSRRRPACARSPPTPFRRPIGSLMLT